MATVTYDPQADALGIIFGPGPSEGEEAYPGVILHFDAENRNVEIEILSASKTLAPGAVDNRTGGRVNPYVLPPSPIASESRPTRKSSRKSRSITPVR